MRSIIYDWLNPQGEERYYDVPIAPVAFYDVFINDYDDPMFTNKKMFVMWIGNNDMKSYIPIEYDPYDGHKLDYIEWVSELWSAFGDIPLTDGTDDIDISFLDFDAGTNRFEIWKWFEKVFDVSIQNDLEV